VAVVIAAFALVPVIAALAVLFAVIDIEWIAFVNIIFRQVKIPD
jgi:hypothetical protein